MVPRNLSLDCLSALSSLFKIQRTTHSISTRWQAHSSRITRSSLSAFLLPPLWRVRRYPRINHPVPWYTHLPTHPLPPTKSLLCTFELATRQLNTPHQSLGKPESISSAQQLSNVHPSLLILQDRRRYSRYWPPLRLLILSASYHLPLQQI